MAMTKQEAINELLMLQRKGEEMSDEEKKRAQELQQYLQSTVGKPMLGSAGKNQMSEMEY